MGRVKKKDGGVPGKLVHDRIDNPDLTRPPRLASALLRLLLGGAADNGALGDLEERWRWWARERGAGYANARYRMQVLAAAPGCVFNSVYWGGIMLRNYLTVARRHITRHGLFSVINIAGLALGFASCLLIALWVHDELGYDRFHPGVERIHQVLARADNMNTTVPVPLGPLLADEYPEITDATRYHWFWGGTIIARGERSFYEDGVRAVDPSFLRIFSFPLVDGDRERALEAPNSIVLTRETARKYFGDEDPMGKTLRLNNEHEMTVTGVMADLPGNSTVRFDMLIPMSFRISLENQWYLDWQNFFVYTFVELEEGYDAADVEDKISGVVASHGGMENARLELLPLTDRHFAFYAEKSNVYIFTAIACFVLVIACLNYINLTTAQSPGRAKEIGMRKIAGASRLHIMLQFLGESVLLSTAALAAGLLLAFLLLPFFNTLTGKDLALAGDGPVLPVFAAFALATGMLAGSYSAFVVSGFKPVRALRGERTAGGRGGSLRKTLTVVQFILASLLIICTSFAARQLAFIRSRDIGYDKEQVVSIPMKGGSHVHYHRLKAELLGDARVIGVTGTAAALPAVHWRTHGWQWEGKDPDERISLSTNYVDYDFTTVLGIEIVEGRGFSEEFPADALHNYLVNEEMAALMGQGPAVGATLSRGDESGVIVGVMRNFHFMSYANRIEPLVLHLDPDNPDNMLVRIPAGDIPAALAFIEETWSRAVPGYPFEFSFLDDDVTSWYRGLERTGTLLASLTGLAVAVACLGILGLSVFLAERRTKEIGIRKVLGSPVAGIFALLTGELVRCILLANLIAWPIAWLAVGRWLEGFAYRGEMTVWPFLLSGAAALAAALATVGWQALRAARANPVESLRYE